MTEQPANALPLNISEVTAVWLSGVTGFDVQSITIEQIGVGVGVSSAVYRIALTGTDCPSSVILKLPALDDAAVFTSTILRMYEREVRFFNELAAHSPIRVPAGHYAASHESGAFVAVMEDLGPLRVVDQNDGMSYADAQRAVDALAGWHAKWWGNAEEHVQSGAAIALSDPLYPAILPMVFGEGWEKVSTGMDVPPAIQSIGPRFAPAIAALLQGLMQGTLTLTHGDYRADNMLFDADGSVALLDFQLIGMASGAYDLAYFVTQSLEPAVASQHERELFDRWVEGLRSAGVADVDSDRLWTDYRTAALFCLVYPIVASRGMDLADPRQYALIDNMLKRFDRACRELDLAALL